MYDKFKLLGKEKEFLIYLEQYVLNTIHKNEKVLRNNISSELYEMIKNTAKVSVNKGNIRLKYISDIKVNIIMLDFYIGILSLKNYIINKRFLTCIRRLEEIRRIVGGFDQNNDEKIL